MLRRLLTSIDYYLLGPVLILVFLSTFILSSFAEDLARAQVIFAFIGVLLYLLILKLDIVLIKSISLYGYCGVLLLLVAVFLIGEVTNGAARWLTIWGELRIQPSEFAKPVLIVTLAALFTWRAFPTSKAFLWSIGLVAMYFFLVYKQPDLGTAITYLVILAAVMYFSPFSLKSMISIVLMMMIVGLAMLPYFWNHLHDYQQKRVITFFDPKADPKGSGYHVLQSMITVGSGGVLGKGFGKGTQSHNNFLPEHYTDFIFATFSEEFGFLGISFLLILYAILFWRILKKIQEIDDAFERYVCIGVLAILLFQVFVNIGMNLGIAPVVGVTLPFFSYGGSSLISFIVCIALVQICSSKRFSI